MAKSIAEQDLAEMGGSRSVLARQRRDHVKLDLLLRELGDTSGAAQEEALSKVCRLVFPHGFAEEAVLWPVLRRSLSDGHELTVEVEREHQEINELVKSLEQGNPSDPGRQEVIGRLIEVLREDVRDEENVLLRRLQEAITVGQLQRLGVVWELVRRIAPTRPHPVISRRPPGNVLAALPLSLVDRFQDRIDRLVRRAPGAVADPLRRSSQAVGRVSARLEHVTVLRRGEDSSTRASRIELAG
jgi:hemerythrin superfamily protein